MHQVTRFRIDNLGPHAHLTYPVDHCTHFRWLSQASMDVSTSVIASGSRWTHAIRKSFIGLQNTNVFAEKPQHGVWLSHGALQQRWAYNHSCYKINLISLPVPLTTDGSTTG